ncbi:MAG: UDP-N-acetylglucosamine 2-epimerase, partial [Candidatus Acidiferrales bacterium]
LECNLAVIRRFIEAHADVAVIFPVHANPQVTGPAQRILGGHPRIHLTEPLGYKDFIQVMSRAWLVVSDSGGVQEEAPSLGKPVLVIRENTERPEAITAGVARLVGGDAGSLMRMLQEAYAGCQWVSEARSIENPFGSDDSGRRVADAIEHLLMHAEKPDLCPAIRGGNG